MIKRAPTVGIVEDISALQVLEVAVKEEVISDEWFNRFPLRAVLREVDFIPTEFCFDAAIIVQVLLIALSITLIVAIESVQPGRCVEACFHHGNSVYH